MLVHVGMVRKYCMYCGRELSKDRHNIPYCPHCEVTFYSNPTPAVAAIVVNNKREILLVLRDKEPSVGKWSLPGGFVEIDESTESAARRELFEETGLKAKNLELFAVDDEPSKRYGRVIVICYIVNDFEGKIVSGDDARDVKYFFIDSIPELPFKSHQKFVEIYKERNR